MIYIYIYVYMGSILFVPFENYRMVCVYIYIYNKGKVDPRTGHEGP